MLRTSDADNSWKWAVLLAIAFAAAIAPTLHILQFSNSMENLNVATALELRRDGGSWLVPTLEGKPRIEKPPLTAWITALAIRSSTLAHLDDHDDASRAAAYEALAVEVRWPALLTASLTIFATFALGKSIVDARTGLIAAAVFASCLFTLKFARSTTTDVQLALWVTVANIFLARAIFDGIAWKNMLPAGVALGLAFMSKGPVAFVQSILPAGLFALFYWRARKREQEPVAQHWVALLVGAVISLIIALWWFVLVAQRDPHMVKIWFTETNPAGADRLRSDNIGLYLLMFPFLAPWLLFLIDGVIRAARIGKFSRITYAAFALIVSLVVMSCFADKRDRYILPLVPFASVIAAQGVTATLNGEKFSVPLWLQWIVLALIALAPLLGTTTFAVKTVDGQPWFSMATACAWSGAALAIVIAGWLISPRGGMVMTTVIIMLVLQAVGVQGYARSREGRSEMFPLAGSIRHDYPTAEMYNWRSDRQPKRASVDLSIYLNRVTTWIDDPAILPASNRPQIYVTPHDRKKPQPLAAPGWKFLMEVPRDNDWYDAFVRDPSPAS